MCDHSRMPDVALRKRAAAEFVGTAFLVAAVVGSGIMAERLAGSVAIALLANTIATGAALLAVILAFGKISGAHFNRAVTIADAIEHGISWHDGVAYIVAQFAGGITGTAIANVMFGMRLFSLSRHVRSVAAVQRVHSNLRFVSRHLGLLKTQRKYNSRRRCRLHYSGVLVYFVNVVRQPCSDASSGLFRFPLWHPPD